MVWQRANKAGEIQCKPEQLQYKYYRLTTLSQWGEQDDEEEDDDDDGEDDEESSSSLPSPPPPQDEPRSRCVVS